MKRKVPIGSISLLTILGAAHRRFDQNDSEDAAMTYLRARIQMLIQSPDQYGGLCSHDDTWLTQSCSHARTAYPSIGQCSTMPSLPLNPMSKFSTFELEGGCVRWRTTARRRDPLAPTGLARSYEPNALR